MISVIIPTYNEEEHIGKTIQWLKENDSKSLITEIIIADGSSNDKTLIEANKAGAVAAISPVKGRAAQMNYGASFAKGTVLYFLHADTLPPKNFTNDIAQAVNNHYGAGCFMVAFDHAHWFLKVNCWFTRFDVNAVRFGDQSLFVAREIFQQVRGFDESYIVLEDQEIIPRLKKQCRFIIIKKPVITSARKYLVNGIYKMQGIFFIIYFMYRFGYSQQKLLNTYRRLIRQNKL
jgi:rSAM/selenodomain-associated transferase 2